MQEEPYRRLPLHSRDGLVKAYALVSAEDFDELSKHRWVLHTNGYVARTVQLHREILDVTDRCLVVDHINHDTLDNRRENLRVATRQQNSHNRYARNVIFERGRWRARVKVDRRTLHLGWYDTEEKARRVVSAFKATRWPFSPDARLQHRPEDVADAMKVRIPRRTSRYEAFSARLMLASTTLQRQQVADVLGVAPSTVTRLART